MGLFGSRKKKGPWAGVQEEDVPHFPTSTLRTLELLRSDDASTEEVSDALALDPGLSVQVLRMVNSSAFGARRSIDDLAVAVSLLGRAALESMVISVAARQALPPDPVAGFDPTAFWAEATHRGILARGLAGLLAPGDTHASFTAAYLSDLAVPILASLITDRYAPLLERWQREGGALHALERETFGWDHAEAAEELCLAWGLPETLARRIGGHHDETAASDAVALAARLPRTASDADLEMLSELVHTEAGVEAKEVLEVLRAATRESGDPGSVPD